MKTWNFLLSFRMDSTRVALASVAVLFSLFAFKTSRKLLSRLVLGKRVRKMKESSPVPTEVTPVATPPTRPSMGGDDHIFYSILRQYRGSESGRKSVGIFKFRTSEG